MISGQCPVELIGFGLKNIKVSKKLLDLDCMPRESRKCFNGNYETTCLMKKNNNFDMHVRDNAGRWSRLIRF